MADITMCYNQECPHRSGCYRARAHITAQYQSISFWEPNEDGTCSAYWPFNLEE